MLSVKDYPDTTKSSIYPLSLSVNAAIQQCQFLAFSPSSWKASLVEPLWKQTTSQGKKLPLAEIRNTAFVGATIPNHGQHRIPSNQTMPEGV